MNYILWLTAGLVLGYALIFYAKQHSGRGEQRIFARALIIAAIIYLLFAVVWGNSSWILIELLGIAAYGCFVWMAIKYSYYWLAVGWGLHPLWDVLLHLLGQGHTIAPEWYAIGCISFDWLIMIYIVFRVSHWQQAELATNSNN